MTAHPDLVAHAGQFPKRFADLAPGIWSAVGFAASNVYVIEGPDSLAVIDTTESTGAAQAILAELRARTAKPVGQIVYTHSHRDHISGAAVFAEGGAPEIIASHRFASDIVGDRGGPQKALRDRTRRQFGFGLDFPGERVNLGCGPGDRPVEGMGAGHLPPTRWITEDRVQASLAGRTADLIHAPGETPDHLIVWLPDRRILFSGDNFYHAFPNLYAIRGTPYRDFAAWADTLDRMLRMAPEVLAPGHTLPIVGAAAIAERLTDYRDAIRFVVEATAAGLNAGRTPDELAAELRLPGRLAGKPWLQEFYGRFAWSVRAYAAGTLGWFDGNPTDLGRLPPAEEARKVIALAGGGDAVLAAAEAADDPQWAMELADRLIAAQDQVQAALRVKVRALRIRAEAEVNATARNYYLSCARELEAETP
ncbi:MAG: alkyl/aryl-sulfatase [Rhodobacter sp.]|nr:alkyl/aryl-sulfatase [Rhodobacter sp.]